MTAGISDRVERTDGVAEDASVEAVTALFAETGVPHRLVLPTLARLGPDAAGHLRTDPWRLLDVPGVTPRQADHFAGRALPAWERDDPRRGRAFVEHLLTRAAGDGHVVFPARMLLAALPSLGVPRPAAAVEAALDAGEVLAFEAPQGDDASTAGPGADGAPPPDADATRGRADAPAAEPGPSLGLARYALAEESLAEGICRLTATAAPAPTAAVEEAARDHGDDVRTAVAAACDHGVCVVETGPGTRDLRRLLRGLAAAAPAARMRLVAAAPTAGAAVALADASDVAVRPLSELPAALRDGRADGAEAAQTDLIVVTGAAALGVESLAALVDACPDGVHLVLAGDPHELPSYCPGRVLGDLRDARRIPVVTVRAEGAAGGDGARDRLAAAVAHGTLPRIDSPDREVVVVPAGNAAEAAHRVVQLVTDSIPRVLGIPAEDVQVVTPVRRGLAGTDALNAALRAALLPGAASAEAREVGDRVLVPGGGPGAGPSEPGVITAAEVGRAQVALPGGRTVTVPEARFPEMRPAWAMTVHRAHGTVWPAVVAVLPGEAAGALSRPLAYTAFTRGLRHLSVVHAAGPALARAVRTTGHPPRHTRLAALLRAQLPAPVASPQA